MARAAAPSATVRDVPVPDAAALVDGWMQSQQRLLTVSMDQWTGLHELWLRSWRQQLDTWADLWRTDGSAPQLNVPAALGSLPSSYWDAMQRANQAWWGPWQPILQRGGEQLG